MNMELWITLRLVVAALFAGIVGYERELTGKSAGLRTHMLVAMGAALFVSANDLTIDIARKIGAAEIPGIQVQVALLSPVQAVATGIGFLGAGTIFVGHRHHAKGLTTAASIWVTAAIGAAVGFDRFLLAALATTLALFVLRVLVHLDVAVDREARPPGDSPGGV